MKKEFILIIYAFFLLIFINFAIMKIKEELSMITILEVGSVAILILLYYFIVSTEVRLASEILEKRLLKVQKAFESVENRFNEEVKILREEVIELKELLKKDAKSAKK